MAQTALQRKLVRTAAAMNAKARRLGAPGQVSSAELGALLLEHDCRCAYCGVDLDPLTASYDHVLAFKNGGVNLIENIVPSCMQDQREKFTKTPEELAVWKSLRVICPIDGVAFRPRWADWKRGMGKYCSRRCAGVAGGRA